MLAKTFFSKTWNKLISWTVPEADILFPKCIEVILIGNLSQGCKTPFLCSQNNCGGSASKKGAGKSLWNVLRSKVLLEKINPTKF